MRQGPAAFVISEIQAGRRLLQISMAACRFVIPMKRNKKQPLRNDCLLKIFSFLI